MKMTSFFAMHQKFRKTSCSAPQKILAALNSCIFKAFLVVGICFVSLGHEVLGDAKPEILVGFQGKTPDDDDVITAKYALEQKKIQGVILFSRNIDNPEQLKFLIDFFKQGDPNAVISIDQEGGAVRRAKGDNFPWAQKMVRQSKYEGDLEKIKDVYKEAAKEMKALGITLIFGPVADLDLNSGGAIGKWGRSFSANPDFVIQACDAVLTIYKENGLKGCIKHCPGHGSSGEDSHEQLPKITVKKEELLPFVHCAKTHPKVAIMWGHLLDEEIDPVFAASMSEKHIHAFNTELAKAGVSEKPLYIADAYEMDAVFDRYQPKEYLQQCHKAGIDVVLMYTTKKGNKQYYEEKMTLRDFLKEKLDIYVDIPSNKMST